MKAAQRFFRDMDGFGEPRAPAVQTGVGSAEGLMKIIKGDSRFPAEPDVLLMFDEFQALIQKSAVQASVLLPAITTLFSQNTYQNATQKTRIDIEKAYISLLAGCTEKTWGQIWTKAGIDIGLPNRLFIVTADAKKRVALPPRWDEAEIERLRQGVGKQISSAPKVMSFDPAGEQAWAKWYEDLPPDEDETKRLDTVGLRLAVLLAITTDKEVIDAETVSTVTRIMNWELAVRQELALPDAPNDAAKMEQAILRAFVRKPECVTRKDLQRATNYSQKGSLDDFNKAIRTLKTNGDIVVQSEETGGRICPGEAE
jgi:hypothetical protein